MDEAICCNSVSLTGVAAQPPVFSHKSRGELFHTFPLEVERLSGYVDTLNVVVRQEMLPLLQDTHLGMLHIDGELRSFNNRSGQGSRLVITVFARQITPPEEAVWENTAVLSGTLCKTPSARFTPMGREICDLMLAVNRRYGRSDYLPCIAWGQNARLAASCQVGDRIALTGRIQSRRYIKKLPEGPEERIAFEVSAAELYKSASED